MHRSLAALALALALTASPALAQTSDGTSCSTQQDGSNGGWFDGFLETLGSVWNWATGGGGSSIEVTTNPQPGVERKDKIEIVRQTCGTTQASYSSQIAIAPEIEGGNYRTVGGKVIPKLGLAQNLEVTLPTDRFNAMATDPSLLPNPFVPESIPPGGSVTLKRETFVALELEAAYRNIVLQSEVKESAGNVVGVSRTEDGMIRLTVGPYEAVQNDMFLGLGTKDYQFGLGNSKRMESGKTVTWTFDPNDPEDRRAYQLALLTGTVNPAGSTLGVGGTNTRPRETVEYIDLKDQSTVKLTLGPIDYDKTWSQSSGLLRVTTRPDGSKTVEGNATYNDESVSVIRNYDPQGRQIGEPAFSVKFDHISEFDRQMLSEAFGQPMPPNDQARLDFTPEQLLAIRDRARQQIAANGGDIMSPFIRWLAEAETPEEVARAIYTSAGTYNFTFQELLTILRYDMRDPRGPMLPPLPGRLSDSIC